MRICVVVHQFPVRSETFIVNQVRELRARGHEIVVVPLTPRPNEPWQYGPELAALVNATAPQPAALPERGLRRWAVTGGLFARSLGRGATSFALARDGAIDAPSDAGRRLLLADRVRAFSPFDLLHVHFATAASAATALRRHGIVTSPVVCSVHGTDATTASEDLLARVRDDVTLFTAGSQFMRDVLAAKGVPVARVRVWPQGVGMDRGPTDRGNRTGLHLVSVGRLVEVKGVADSLRVVARARPRVADLRYTVVGAGELRTDLERLAGELGIADITEFRGALDHDAVLDAYDAADVFLQMGVIARTGAQEGQGLAPAEAAASGLPCIVTRAGGLPETVTDGVTGRVVSIGDVDGAADALVELARDPARRAEMGRQGRARVDAEFSLASSIAALERIYDEALGGG